MENGTNNRINAIHHKIKNVFFGNLLISTALNTTISKIITVHGNMPEIANGLSEAMVQRTESISILSVIWLAGLLLCFGFFAVSYIKCYREFRFSLPVENDILEAWKEKHPLKRSLSIRQTETIAALIITANLDVFFIFIIALILSSIAFLLKLLHNGVSPLFFSSIDIKAVAYTDFISIPNLRTTVSSQDNSKSLLKRIYITHTRG